MVKEKGTTGEKPFEWGVYNNITIHFDTEEIVGGTVTAYLKGDITEDTVYDLQEELDILITAHKPSVLILDFSAVTFMDNYGVGLILGRYNAVLTYGGTLKVQSANEQMKRAITLSGIDRIISVNK